MESEKRTIKKIKELYTELNVKLVDPAWKFPGGGKNERLLSDFLHLFYKAYGESCTNRIVDYCIYQAYMYRDPSSSTIKWTTAHSFGKNAIKRYANRNENIKYYENKWLAERNLKRSDYYENTEIKTKEHPLAKFIDMPADEPTKRRFLNSKIGFFLCCQSTLGWSPTSSACLECNYVDECKNHVKRTYPELYRLRVEYGK